MEQYVNSLYWAIQTMCTVGYGDLPSRTNNERMFATLSMIISVGVYAITLNDVAKIVRGYNVLAYNY